MKQCSTFRVGAVEGGKNFRKERWGPGCFLFGVKTVQPIGSLPESHSSHIPLCFIVSLHWMALSRQTSWSFEISSHLLCMLKPAVTPKTESLRFSTSSCLFVPIKDSQWKKERHRFCVPCSTVMVHWGYFELEGGGGTLWINLKLRRKHIVFLGFKCSDFLCIFLYWASLCFFFQTQWVIGPGTQALSGSSP